MKKYIPFLHVQNIFELNVEFYKKHNIKFILCDLDNTLDNRLLEVASDRTKAYINNLKENGITVIITSNNNHERVQKYAESLGVQFVFRCCKPFTKKIKNYLLSQKIDLKNTLMIGDQLSTDIKCGNRLGVFTVFTEKLENNESLVTKINRIRDNIIKKILIKKNLLKGLED